MLFSFLLFFSACHGITCLHDFYQHKVLREITEPIRRVEETVDDAAERQPIRIDFNMDSIDDASKDSQQCTSAIGTCTSDDILDDTKRATIKNTFYTVRDFLQNNINITRRSTDTYDLTISVYARPFGSSSTGLAYASSLEYNGVGGRPSVGQIVVNPAKLPSSAQTFDSGERQFIITVLHELNHVLSFSSSLFGRWQTNVSSAIHYTDGYGSEITAAEFSSYSGGLVSHEYLRTPHLLNYVNERFHIHNETLKTLGLEIEDGGGSGTAGSHPNERLFFTDLMQGRTYGPGWISPIFYNTLLDTGWYTPSTEVIEDLVYLDDSLNAKITLTEDILLQPPRKSFPPAYLCTSAALQACFYDYSYTGACSLMSSSEADYDGHEDWYNPHSSSNVGSDNLLDYTPLVLPWYSCRTNGSAGLGTIQAYQSGYDYTKYGETFSANSTCALSTLSSGITGGLIAQPRCYEAWCGSDNKVRLVVNDEEFYCKYDGQSASFSNFAGYVTCPPAGAVCANRPKKEVFGVTSIMPDRGPIDGQNLVGITGNGYSKYNQSDVTITLGTIPCRIKIYKDNYIVCRLDQPDDATQKTLKKKSFSITSTATAQNPYRALVANVTTLGVTTLPDMYVFVNRKYAS